MLLQIRWKFSVIVSSVIVYSQSNLNSWRTLPLFCQIITEKKTREGPALKLVLPLFKVQLALVSVWETSLVEPGTESWDRPLITCDVLLHLSNLAWIVMSKKFCLTRLIRHFKLFRFVLHGRTLSRHQGGRCSMSDGDGQQLSTLHFAASESTAATNRGDLPLSRKR